MQTSSQGLIDGTKDGPLVDVGFQVEATMAVPPWVQGALSAESGERLKTSIEGHLMGGARYEQLFRATGSLKVGDDEHGFAGTGLRIRRQGVRKLAGFWGHSWQSALFPSGRAFGYIAYPPRPDGEPTFNEGYLFHPDGDGDLIPARVVEAPWLTDLKPAGEDVALVLETSSGTVQIEGETILSTHDVYHDDTMFSAQALKQEMPSFPRCSRPACATAGTAKRPSACWSGPSHSTKSPGPAAATDLLQTCCMNTETKLQRWERSAEWPLAAAALLFLGLFSVQVLVRPHGSEAHILWAVDWIIWGVFVLDYGVRLSLAPNRWHWFIRHLVDFAIVTLPFVRPLRLLRLLVLIEVLQKAVGDAFRGRIVVYTVSGVVLLIYTASLAVFDRERSLPGATINTFGKAIWWSITTVTTVGYGDVYPVSNAGRVIAVLLMIGGISLVGVVTAALASWVIQTVAAEEGVSQAATAAHIEELRDEIRALAEQIQARD